MTIHVDDISVNGEENFVSKTIDAISSRFEISSNPELQHFPCLGIKCDVPDWKIYSSQEHYLKELTARFLPNGYTCMKTPTSSSFKDLVPGVESETQSSSHFFSLTSPYYGMLNSLEQTSLAQSSTYLNFPEILLRLTVK